MNCPCRWKINDVILVYFNFQSTCCYLICVPKVSVWQRLVIITICISLFFFLLCIELNYFFCPLKLETCNTVLHNEYSIKSKYYFQICLIKISHIQSVIFFPSSIVIQGTFLIWRHWDRRILCLWMTTWSRFYHCSSPLHLMNIIRLLNK